MPKFWGAAALAGWTQVRTAVHEAGGRIGPQLQHVGGCPNPFMEWRPAAEFETPSGDIVYGGTAHTLSLAEIDDVIDAFANAARNARDIGFDLAIPTPGDVFAVAVAQFSVRRCGRVSPRQFRRTTRF